MSDGRDGGGEDYMKCFSKKAQDVAHTSICYRLKIM